jgi:hypothetical protein
MAAQKHSDTHGEHNLTVTEVIMMVATVITTVLTILAFVFKFPLCAGILAIITSVLLGIFLALHDRMPKWVRLSLILFVLLLLAVGLWLIISSLEPPNGGIRPDEPNGGLPVKSPPVSPEPVGGEKVGTSPGGSDSKSKAQPKTWDFEKDVEGWGEHPDNERHITGQAVRIYRDGQPAIRNTRESSLQFTPKKIKDGNAYVTVLHDAQGYAIKAFIYVVGNDPNLSSVKAGSTAKICVWDQKWVLHESDYTELQPDSWQSISWDVRGELWPGPWREFGIHYWFVTGYKGPVYIDSVTISVPPEAQ